MRKALIVIDMQYDFIDGSLGTNEAQNILPNVNDLIDKKDYDNLFFTRDTHYENYLDTQEGKKFTCKTLYKKYTRMADTRYIKYGWCRNN